MLSAPACEEPVACDSRRLLDPGFRLLSRPDEDFVANASCRQPGVKPLSLRAALRTETMVHGQRTDFAMPRARPTIRQNRKRQAIGATGHGDGEERTKLEAGESGECAAEFLKSQRLCRRYLGQQPSRFFSVTARSLIALPGFGKSWSSCANARHALCFWLSRASDIESFSRSSGAFIPFG